MFLIKIIWALVINLDLIIIALLCISAIKSWRGQLGPKLKTLNGVAGIFLVFMLGDFPFSGRDVLRRLESHFPVIAVPSDIHGIVITGGSLCLYETEIRGEAVYHKTAGKLFDALKIAHAHPHAEIIFAGTFHEHVEFAKLATSLGISKSRIKVTDVDDKFGSLEAVAANATKIARDSKDKKWLLITSAFTMPRTLNIFQSHGWHLTPFPVDFHTIGHPHDKHPTGFLKRLILSFQDRLGLVAWNIAWREIAGLTNLRLSGKTKTFFPNSSTTT